MPIDPSKIGKVIDYADKISKKPTQPGGKQFGEVLNSKDAAATQNSKASGAVNPSLQAEKTGKTSGATANIKANSPENIFMHMGKSVVKDQNTLNSMVSKLVLTDKPMSPKQLLITQSVIHHLTLEVNMAVKVVENAAHSFKTVMQTQV